MADQPGYTRMPNALLELLPLLPDAECRVLLAIARKTLGWQKACDVISLSQLESATGLSRQGVINGVEAAIKRGILKREPSGFNNGYCYEIVTDQVVNEVDHLKQSTKLTSQRSRPLVVNEVDHLGPQVVNEVDTQKKDLKQKKEKRVRTPKQATLDQFNEACQIAKDTIGKKLTPGQASSIAETVHDIPRWTQVVAAWDKRYGTMNVEGLLDWYEHPEKMDQRNGYRNGSSKLLRQSPGRNSERGPITQADLDKPF